MFSRGSRAAKNVAVCATALAAASFAGGCRDGTPTKENPVPSNTNHVAVTSSQPAEQSTTQLSQTQEPGSARPLPSDSAPASTTSDTPAPEHLDTADEKIPPVAPLEDLKFVQISKTRIDQDCWQQQIGKLLALIDQNDPQKGLIPLRVLVHKTHPVVTEILNGVHFSFRYQGNQYLVPLSANPKIVRIDPAGRYAAFDVPQSSGFSPANCVKK